MKNKEQRFATLAAEELSPGWTLATIGEMIDTDGVFTDGDWVVSKDQDPNGDVRLVQLADIGDGFWVNKSSRYLTYEKAIELGCTFLKPGDVLIARMPDPLGRACIFPGDFKSCITAVDVCIVRTGNQGINHRWLMHTINSPNARVVIESLQSGSTRKRISRKNLGRIEFPLPPSPEQRRIVAEIETQFTRLDAAVAGLERAKANIRRYKAAVLQAACEGRLVPTEAELAHAEGRDYEPTDQLLARILAERRVRWEAEHPGKKYKEPAPPDKERLSEVLEGWVWASVAQLAENIQYGYTESAKDDPVGPKFLRITDIQDGRVNWDTVPYCECPEEKHAKYRLEPGDIVFARTGATTGKSYLIVNCPDAVFASYLIRLQMNESLNVKYLALFLDSPLYWPQIMTVRKGSAQPGVNATILATLHVPLPPLPEQRRIVAEVERRLSVVEALEVSVEAALVRAGQLRQAVLKQAFEGRLVEQDPNDEPASVLLERIRAEREDQSSGKSKGKQLRLL